VAENIADQLTADMKDAMRSGDKVRLGAIRRARAAVKNAEIEAGGTLDDEDTIKVLRVMARQHEESIQQFTDAGRTELVEKERAELEALEIYLPAQLDQDAVDTVVAEVIATQGASSMKDIGGVMKAAMARLGSSADGRMVNDAAKRLLNG
jgi:uncharacterized protein YqeY